MTYPDIPDHTVISTDAMVLPAVVAATHSIISDTLDQFRRSGKADRRHPAQVTSDRLGDATTKWGDKFTGAELDMIGVIRSVLEEIAEGE
jgi:hypothetical protein